MAYDKNGQLIKTSSKDIEMDALQGMTLDDAYKQKKLGVDVKKTLSGGETDSPPSVAAVNSGLANKASKTELATGLAGKQAVGDYATKSDLNAKANKTDVNSSLATKQDKLVSGTNLKTINNQSLLGSGNITIQGGGGSDVVAGTNVTIETTSDGKKKINANIPTGTTQVASQVAYTNSDGTSTNVQTKLTELDSKVGGETKHFYVGFGNVDNQTYFSKVVDGLYAVQKCQTYSVLHISQGTYDIYEELGGRDYIESKSTATDAYREVQPYFDNAKILGHGRVLLNFVLPSDIAYEHYWLFSCLNCCGNVEIENIEIYAKNCRYAIHDESAKTYPYTTHIYRNVKAYKGGNGAGTISCGTSAYSKMILENCVLTNGYNDGYTCHANEGCEFIIKNCIIKATQKTMGVRISQNGAGNIPLNLYVERSYIPKINLKDEVSTGNFTCLTNARMVDCPIVNVSVNYANINSYGYKVDTTEGTETIIYEPNI